MSLLAGAFDRLDAFCAVQRGSITLDAVLRLQEAAGVDDEDRRTLLERPPAIGDADAAAVLLGVVLARLTA